MAASRSWTACYEPGVPRVLPPVEAPFHAALEAAAATTPGYPALTFYNGTLRFAELNALADAVAAALQRDGLSAGDRVLMVLPDCPALAAACLGAMKAGGVAAPVPWGLDRSRLVLAAARVAPQYAIAAAGAAAAVREVVGEAVGTLVAVDPRQDLPLTVRLVVRLAGRRRGVPRRAVAACGAVMWSDWLAGAGPAEVEVHPDAPALLLAPARRGATSQLFHHRHLVAGAAQLAAWLTDALPGEDTWLQLAPLWTGLGFVAGLGAAMVLRARVALVPHRRPTEVLDALRFLRPAFVVAGRRATTALAGEPELAHADLRWVRAWITGQLLPSATEHAFEELAGFSLCLGYSPLGVAGLAVCNPVNARRAAGSIGIPLPGVEIRLVDAAGEPVSPGLPGYLEVAGPNVAADGWLPTGLLARLDEMGFVFPVDDSRPPPRSGIL